MRWRVPLGRACIVALLVAASCASEPPASDPVTRGRQVYAALDCASCHEARLFGLLARSGPPLDHVGTLAAARKEGTSAPDYLRESIESPGAYVVRGYRDVMPRGLAQKLSAADLDALVRYLLSLE